MVTAEKRALYNQDLEKMTSVGKILRSRAEEFGLSRKELTDKFAKDLQVNPITAYALIGNYYNGNATLGISQHALKPNTPEKLYKLALFCTYFELSPKDEAIIKITQVNSDFQYPPKIT